jgi:hypothetical protein
VDGASAPMPTRWMVVTLQPSLDILPTACARTSSLHSSVSVVACALLQPEICRGSRSSEEEGSCRRGVATQNCCKGAAGAVS